MTIGERIKELREAMHLSQRALARRSGINFETIQKLEAGTQRDVGLRMAMKIARGLGVHMDAFVRDVDTDVEPAVALTVGN